MEIGPPGKRGDAGVTGRQARPLGRQFVVRRAAAQDNPVAVIAKFIRKVKLAVKGRPRLQAQRISTTRAIDRSLQAFTFADIVRLPRGRGIRDCAVDVYAGKFSGTIKFAGGWVGRGRRIFRDLCLLTEAYDTGK